MAHRYEKQRGAWVLARAGRRAGARRRGEILTARARRQDRRDVGVGDAAVAEVTTPSWVRRSIMREDGMDNQAGWAVYTIAVIAVVAVAVGPALVLGWVVYAMWVWRSPSTAAKPSWEAPAAVALLAGLLAGLSQVTHPVDGVVDVWWRVQPAVGFAYTAWLTVAWGWPAVTADGGAADDVVELVVGGADTAAPVADVVVDVGEQDAPGDVDGDAETDGMGSTGEGDDGAVVIEIDVEEEERGA